MAFFLDFGAINANPMLRNATIIYPILNDWKISITFNPEKNAKVGRKINRVPIKELRHEITKNTTKYFLFLISLNFILSSVSTFSSSIVPGSSFEF